MESLAALGVLVVLAVLGSGIVAFLLVIATRGRTSRLEGRADSASLALERLEKQLLDLKREVRVLRERFEGGAAAAPAPEPVPAPGPPVRAVPEPAAAAPEAPPAVAVPPVIATAPEAAAPTAVAVPLEPAAPPAGAAPLSEPPPIPPEALEPRVVPPPPFTAPPPAPAAPRLRIDWESFVGVKLFSVIGGIAFAIGAVFGLRLAIEHGWLKPVYRATGGVLAGAGLVAFCETRFARRYSPTANALEAAGLFTLFATLFAAHARWHLIPAVWTFAVLAVVAAVAVALSIRRDSIFIALLGLLGGFATPALLSTGEDRPFGLFGYLLLLNAGLAWVAYKKRWPVLGVLALAGTTLYQWAWVAKFLAPGKLPIALGIFLVFPVLSVLFQAREKEGDGGRAADVFRATTAACAALPAAFALYLAAVPAYASRFGMLFGFLAVLVAGLSAVAIARRMPLLHVAAGVSTLLVLAVWLSISYVPAAWPAILGIVALFVLLHLGVALAERSAAPPFRRFLAIVPAALLFAFPALAALEEKAAAPAPFFGVLLLLTAFLAAFALFREEGLAHFTGAFFALAAEAVWSMRHLTRERLLAALLVYGAFALFYLGVPLLARRLSRTLRPEGSGSVALFLSIGLLFFLAGGPAADAALWGMALLLAVINLGLIVEARTPGGARTALWGMALSWGVLVVWWRTAPLGALLVPALVATAGFAVVIVSGVLAAGKVRGAAGDILGDGAYLALVGHLFLLFVVSQEALALPPWPVFGVLLVLDLALGVAAVATRRGPLHLAAVALSQLVLLVWLGVAGRPPWPMVALVASACVALFAAAWLLLARRRKVDERPFGWALLASLFLAEAVAVHAMLRPGAPDAGLLAAFHLALAAALLWGAFTTGRLAAALLAVPAVGAGVAVFDLELLEKAGWRAEALVALAALVPFVAFPTLLGPRVGARREPHLAAVLAAAGFFFAARHALVAGGYAPVIGLLPVALAGVLLFLLRGLLRIERAGERDEARLAVVAGGALAFVTVAIPLQLEKEWITIGWALQAAALAWLFRRIPHRGLLLFASGLFVAVFVRLVLNRAVFDYHPRGGMPVFNWYLYTYLVAALAFFAGALLLRPTQDRLAERLPRVSDLLPGGGTVLLFLLLNIEIADKFSKGRNLTFDFLSASLAQDLSYTLGWALFAIGLLAAGIWLRSRTARFAAVALLAVTIGKCFVHDLSRLKDVYRVLSFLGLGLCLTLVAIAFQRFVLPRKGAPER